MQLNLFALRSCAKLATPVALVDVGYKFWHLTMDGMNELASAEFNDFIDWWQVHDGHLLTLVQHSGSEAWYAVVSAFSTLDGGLAIFVLLTHAAHIFREKLDRKAKHQNSILPMDK